VETLAAPDRHVRSNKTAEEIMKKLVTVCLLMAGFPIATLSYAGQEFKIRVNGGTLHGTLEVPSGEPPCPAAVIISGSGPTDRDGNNPLTRGKNNSLKLLAESLASNGIASLRYDKRGVGASAPAMTKEEDLRFETYIDDAVMWGKELQRDKRFTYVAIIGHSEGSLIGLAACQKMGAKAFVSIAGTGIPASELLLSQLKPKLPIDLFDDAETIIDSLNHGKMVDPVPPTLNPLFRKSVQPYLISWFRYDPAKEIAKLKIPILIMHGSTDIQMDLDNARVLAKSNRLAKLVTINGMNHILKKVSGNLQKQISSYGDPSLPIAEELVEEITAFMMSVETTRPNKIIY
jgi:pimeloyl-ACP methyl ester carboxylesterase